MEVIERVARMAVKRFSFAPFDRDDLAQEARLEAIKALGKYDEERPLFNFLAVHVHNRICNYLRDHWRRQDSPCRDYCGRGDPCGEGGEMCEAHRVWEEIQRGRADLRSPCGLFDDDEELGREGGEAGAEEAELWAMIDEGLPGPMREDYLKLRAGAPLGAKRKESLLEAIRGIVGRG